jgi:hypothetical protein
LPFTIGSIPDLALRTIVEERYARGRATDALCEV